MPLRDLYRPPISKLVSWEGFHAMWAMTVVQRISGQLPPRYTPEPHSDRGTYRIVREIETIADHSEPLKAHAYEVLIFDNEQGRQLVAAVEFVSPANKERPDSRRMFAAKCANLLRDRICVTIVDVVTIRQFNLCAELFAELGFGLPFATSPPSLYAATCRQVTKNGETRIEAWALPLAIGHPLPTLPIWLEEDVCVPLDLEASYEDACRPLKIT